MSRWISCVRPPILPLTDSRSVRSAVARGSIEYSAVTQPVPLPRRWGGTRSTIVAAHRTSVSPTRIRHEPSAHFWTPSVNVTGRRSVSPRPSATTPAAALPLHATEPATELGIGGTDGRLGLNPAAAGEVDQDGHEVAELLAPFSVVGGPAQLTGLLHDLVEDSIDRRPVVAEIRRPFLHLRARLQRRHERADPIEGILRRHHSARLVRLGCECSRRPFVRLDSFPLAV